MATLKSSTKNLETAREAYQWVKAGYANAHQAKTEGRPVAWVMFGVPLEIVYTMGITPIFPENYGTLCAAKRVGYKFCEAAEQDGFNFEQSCPGWNTPDEQPLLRVLSVQVPANTLMSAFPSFQTRFIGHCSYLS